MKGIHTTACKNSRRDSHPVVQAGMVDNLHDSRDGSGFWIGCAEDKPGDAGVDDGSGAHGAGLKGDVERASTKPIIPQFTSGFAQGDDLGVAAGIVCGGDLIPSAADDAAIADDHGSYGDFASYFGPMGQAERLLHPEFVWYLALSFSAIVHIHILIASVAALKQS